MFSSIQPLPRLPLFWRVVTPAPIHKRPFSKASSLQFPSIFPDEQGFPTVVAFFGASTVLHVGIQFVGSSLNVALVYVFSYFSTNFRFVLLYAIYFFIPGFFVFNARCRERHFNIINGDLALSSLCLESGVLSFDLATDW